MCRELIYYRAGALVNFLFAEASGEAGIGAIAGKRCGRGRGTSPAISARFTRARIQFVVAKLSAPS